jgi:hypothetical protein
MREQAETRPSRRGLGFSRPDGKNKSFWQYEIDLEAAIDMSFRGSDRPSFCSFPCNQAISGCVAA